MPAREFPLNDKGIEEFRRSFRERFSGNPIDSPLYQQISNGEASPGVEYYLSLFYEVTSTFFDYLPKNTLIVLDEEVNANADIFWGEIQERYQQLRYDTTRPLCEPQEIFISKDEFYNAIKLKTQIKLSSTRGHFNLECETR